MSSVPIGFVTLGGYLDCKETGIIHLIGWCIYGIVFILVVNYFESLLK